MIHFLFTCPETDFFLGHQRHTARDPHNRIQNPRKNLCPRRKKPDTLHMASYFFLPRNSHIDEKIEFGTHRIFFFAFAFISILEICRCPDQINRLGMISLTPIPGGDLFCGFSPRFKKVFFLPEICVEKLLSGIHIIIFIFFGFLPRAIFTPENLTWRTTD